MKKIRIHKRILIIASLLWGAFGIYGQDIVVEYTADTTVNIGKYDRLYQVASEQKVEINTLMKFDAVKWGQLKPAFTLEQRIWNDLTIEPSVSFSSFKWSLKDGFNFGLNPDLAVKYYINRNHRLRRGKNTIGFSADYILVGLSYTLTDDKDFYNYELGNKHINHDGGASELEKDFYSYYSWRAMYGLQRRIGNVAYADFSVGVEKYYFNGFGHSKLMPSVNIKLGFVLSGVQLKRLSQ